MLGRGAGRVEGSGFCHVTVVLRRLFGQGEAVGCDEERGACGGRPEVGGGIAREREEGIEVTCDHCVSIRQRRDRAR